VRAPSGEEGRDESSLNRLEELVTWRLAANDAQSLRAMPAAAAGAGAAAKIHATGASLLSKWRKEYRNASLPAHLLDKVIDPVLESAAFAMIIADEYQSLSCLM